MAVAARMSLAIPEAIGVLVFWVVVAVVPLLFLRWLRRRGSARVGAMPMDGRTAGLGSTAVAPALSFEPRRGRRGDSYVSPQTLEPLCRHVDFARRLDLAVSELERKLSVLPADRWRIERYPLTGERRNSLLVLGETGVFVISATYAPGHWDDVVTVHRLAAKIELLLLGYPGEVHPAICHPFCSVAPRIWHRPGEEGEWVAAWLVGGDSVVTWLEHFGSDGGLGRADLARFDELSRPNWLRAAIPASPSWPPLPGWAPFPRE